MAGPKETGPFFPSLSLDLTGEQLGQEKRRGFIKCEVLPGWSLLHFGWEEAAGEVVAWRLCPWTLEVCPGNPGAEAGMALFSRQQ